MAKTKISLMDLFMRIKWASSGTIYDMSKTNYNWGWGYLGDDTPTVQDFNFVQQKNDEKDKWLFDQINELLKDQGITASDDEVTSLRDAIKGMIEPFKNDLKAPDGFKHIGRCKSIAELRTIRPTEHGQRILVDAYYEGGTTGGGEFVADLHDVVTVDDEGTCFVVQNNGGRWKRLYTELSDLDFGMVGDGQDETNKLQNALNAAVHKSFKLSRGKTYSISSITIPQYSNIDANHAILCKLRASEIYGLKIEGDVKISNLGFNSPGSLIDRAVRVTGNAVSINGLSIISDTQGSSYGLHVQALDVNTSLTNIDIQNISIKNYDAAMPIFNVKNSSFKNIDINTYRTGVYLRDVSNASFDGANLSIQSPNAMGAPGQNGLLIESTLEAYASQDLHFINWVVADAAEHSYRLGGQLSIRNVTFTNCISKKSGNHGGSSSGGCGFKILGATSVVSRHKNIKLIGCHVEDVNVKSGHDNFSAYLIAVVDGVVLSGCSASKVTNTDYSCIDGIQIDGATDVVLIGNNIQDSNRQSIRCVASTYVGQVGQDGVIDKLSVVGGLYQSKHRNNAPIVFFDVNTSAAKPGSISNVSFRGVSLRGGMAAVRSNDRITYSNIFMDFDYDNGLNSGATPVIPGKGDIFYNAQIPWIGYSPTAQNGSMIVDTLTGAVRLRKNDSWVII